MNLKVEIHRHEPETMTLYLTVEEAAIIQRADDILEGKMDAINMPENRVKDVLKAKELLETKMPVGYFPGDWEILK